jgi:hypothetical protein
MNREKKRFFVFGLIFLLSVVVLAVGWKYFPFAKVVQMATGSKKTADAPQKVQQLSPNTLYNDFEIPPGKDVPGGYHKGQAHSGQYSVKAFGANSFSVAMEHTVREVGVENMKAVAMSAWIYVFPTKSEVKGNLVFTASDKDGKSICWQGLLLAEPEVPKGKWFKISSYFDLSAVRFYPDCKFQVYFWNNSSTDILIDDYFLSFGGETGRRGDSARVDMTKPAGFVAKFNYPPFPVSLLENEPLKISVPPAEIDRSDFILAGNFFNTGNDGLMVIRKDGRMSSWAFCPEKREFKKVILSNPNACASIGQVKQILKGKYLSAAADQLIVIGNKGWMIVSINLPENSCTTAGSLQSGCSVLWKSESPPADLVAGDFNGDQKAEILEIAVNGSWKVLSFVANDKTSGSWKELYADKNSPVNEWDRNLQVTGIFAGRFLQGFTSEVLLTVTRKKSDGTYAWSLRRLNTTAGKWDPVFGEKQGHLGKTIGLDTLKPEDNFFSVPAGGNRMAIYRYNRDWRFDMKEIRFNDSTFSILAGVDFHGFPKDQNPKYYEFLSLIPGKFLNQPAGSFLAVGHIAKVRRYQAILPDFVQLYSLPANK